MGLFVGFVDGLSDLQEFEAAFTEQIEDELWSGGIAAEPSVSESTGVPVIVAYSVENPLSQVAAAFERAGWSLGFSDWLPSLPNPKALITVCDMPHNPSAVASSRFRACANGHNIETAHRVSNCPVCGKPL